MGILCKMRPASIKRSNTVEPASCRSCHLVSWQWRRHERRWKSFSGWVSSVCFCTAACCFLGIVVPPGQFHFESWSMFDAAGASHRGFRWIQLRPCLCWTALALPHVFHIHIYIYVYIYIHIRMHACMHACMYVRIYIYIYIWAA